MELILTEWMGAGEKPILLEDDKIFELYKKFQESNKYKEIENYKEKLLKIFSDKFDKITSEINKLNTFHRNIIKGDNVNPIIEIYKNKEQYFVKTYQYVTEFEIFYTPTNSLKIKIQPRNLVSESNYKDMMGYLFNVKILDKISGGESNDFIVLFYLAFLTKLKEVLRRGIHREYVDYEDNLPYLKERLLIHEHTRYNYVDKSKFYCGYSELSPDNLINKAILKSIFHIKKIKSTAISKHIHQISQAIDLSEITNTNFNLRELDSIRFNRQNNRYKEIVDYCKVILRNSGTSFSSKSDLKYSSFYLDMNDLFESFFVKKLEELFNKENNNEEEEKLDSSKLDLSIFEIIEIIKENDESKEVKYYSVKSQNKMWLDESGTFNIIPDVIVYDENDVVVAVLDTKYKRLNESQRYNYNISREDIYQVITYAHKLETKKAFLVYPKPPQQNIDNMKFEINDIILHICFVDLKNETPKKTLT